MIQSLKIKNFQSHKESELVFDSGLNIITGPSDSGKTAILRSLYWLFNNRPSGEEFRSNWGGDTVVQVRIDGKIIRRTKGSKNEYFFNKISNVAFGQDVPEEIKSFLNIQEINLQRQLDEPFLLNLSPGKVAEHFNRLARIDDIDNAIKEIQKDIRSTNILIETRKKDIEGKNTELLKYKGIKEIDKRLQSLEEKDLERIELSKVKNSILVLLSQLVDVEIENKTLQKIILFEPIINSLITKRNLLKSKKDEYKSLVFEIGKITDITRRERVNSKLISLKSKVNDLLEIYTRLNSTKTVLNHLKNLIVVYTTLQNKLIVANDTLNETSKLLQDNLIICPLCGTNLKNKKHDH